MSNPHFILLVDDSEDDAFFFERAVARTGAPIQTRRARDGQEAIDYLLGEGEFSDREKFPMPHLILLDLKMPVCDGFKFLAWKRERESLACIPTVVMTSSNMEQDIRRCYALGAHSFTTKLVTTDRLAERLLALRNWWFENVLLLNPPANPLSGQPLPAAKI
jgi:CheY-like chemotaxis protein